MTMATSTWSRWVTVRTVLLLALIAAVVSYSHMYELALRHGEPEWHAALFPLSVDGMIVAASMMLLSDARRGRKGGVLPWALLIIGSGASLAANVAVTDPTLWSRIIHAWPSFALIGAYELLMREFRGSASRTRETPEGEPSHEQAENSEGTTAVAAGQSSGPLHVVSERAEVSSQGREAKLDEVLPRVQVEAWYWTLNNRGEDGALPTGKEIGRAFGRKERWGRLVKRRGEQGVLRVGPDIHDADGSEMSAVQEH